MRRLAAVSALAFLSACAGTPPLADTPLQTEVTGKVLQRGVYTDPTCDGMQDERIDTCSCEADITAAQTGDAAIDARLLRVAERKICKGLPISALKPQQINQRKLDYTVTRDDAAWLSILYTYYEMNAGAAHGMTTQQAMLYDKKAQRWVGQAELVFPAHREGASNAVIAALKKADAAQYDGMLWPENVERVFTEKGCEGCILYPDATGWKVTFMPYGAGPYVAGLVTVPLDGGFVAQ